MYTLPPPRKGDRRRSSVAAAAALAPPPATLWGRLWALKSEVDTWWAGMLRRYWVLAAGIAATSRLVYVWDIASDVLVANDLMDRGHVWWARIIAGLVLLPRLVCFVGLMAALRAFLRDTIEAHWRRLALLCLYFVLGLPALLVLDLALATRYLTASLHDTQHLLHYNHLRELTEVLLESVPQTVFQVYVSIKLTTEVDVWLLTSSIAVSVASVATQWLSVRRNARARGVPVREYLTLVLNYGVGFVPYLAGIRDGALKEASYAGLGLQEHGLAVVAEAVTHGQTLLALDLADNDLQPEAVVIVADMLAARSCPLRALNLACNDLGPSGAKALAVALTQSPALLRLGLSDCALCGVQMTEEGEGWEGAYSSRGVDALCAALGFQSGLRYLDVGFNGLGAQGAHALAALVADSKALQVLKACTNSLTRSREPRDLESSGGDPDFEFDVDGLVALAESARVSTTLVALDLSDNDVTCMGSRAGLRGARALAAAAEHCPSLLQLDLRFNDVSMYCPDLFDGATCAVLLDPGDAPSVDIDEVVDVGVKLRAARGGLEVR